MATNISEERYVNTPRRLLLDSSLMVNFQYDNGMLVYSYGISHKIGFWEGRSFLQMSSSVHQGFTYAGIKRQSYSFRVGSEDRACL
jgi:hypothetical protein